jgi:hypothetical protein
VALLTKKYLATMDCLGKVLYLISSTTSDEDKKFTPLTPGLSQRFFKRLLFPKSVWPLFVYKTIEFQLDSRLSTQEHLSYAQYNSKLLGICCSAYFACFPLNTLYIRDIQLIDCPFLC